MNNKLEIAQDKFVESIGKLAESFGLNAFTAQLYAVLYLSEKPLSMDELAERLMASKGNISLNIRQLEQWGAVKSVWVKGSRKNYYEADHNIRKVAADRIRSSVGKRIREISSMLSEFTGMVDSAEGDLSDAEKKIVKGYRDRIKRLEELNDLASKALMFAEKLF